MSDPDYRDSGLAPDLVANAPDVRRMVLSKSQTQGFTAMDRYLSLEGAYRSGKTTDGLLKVGAWCWDYPGIPWLLSRWTDENTFSQLRPAFLELWGDRVYKWLPDEKCYLIYSKDSETKGIYSRVHFTGLRPSEGTSPFSKVHGKKIACALWDQPEEIPEEYFEHMRTRLSAPKFPQQLILCPNPQIKTHWLSTTFPEDNARRSEGYFLVKFRMRDNVSGLGEDYIAARERELRRKPAEFRRALLGERGLPMAGKPIFGEVFDRERHATAVAFNPHLPLYESIDYGHRHPAVTWTQYPGGRMHVLGGVMGVDMLLELFIPEVIAIREEWFPGLHPSLLHWTADPAGSARNSQGSRSGVDILQDFGIVPYIGSGDGNQPPRQDYAIQMIGGYLERTWYDGSPVFAVDPHRFVIVNKHGERHADSVLVDGFEVGFIWDDDKTYGNTLYPHVRPWKRDKWFEHPFVTLLYSVLAFAPVDAAAQVGVLRNPDAIRRARRELGQQGLGATDIHAVLCGAERRRLLEARVENQRQREEQRALRERQKDHDPYDRVRRAGQAPRMGRGGYH